MLLHIFRAIGGRKTDAKRPVTPYKLDTISIALVYNKATPSYHSQGMWPDVINVQQSEKESWFRDNVDMLKM
jgi:hypothetical protein